jgi:hypothetical protein
MLRGIGISGASNAGLASRAMRGSPLGYTPPLTPPRSSPRQDQYSGAFDDGIPGESDDYPEPPPFDTVPLLPVEIGLHYTYPEPFGEAEVTYILPAGQPYILASGEEILNDDLKPGMRICLKDGAVATISHVELYYEPPDPPERGEDGRVLSRVVGTIKHKGFATVDVCWPGYKATSSPDHPYYSVSRGGYVGAQELRVGEFLRTDDNLLTPVLSVSKPQFGMLDLYNVEVEHYHNYYVGEPGGSAVLVHNSATPGNYINTPAEGTAKRLRQIPKEDGYWSNSPAKGAPADGVPGESYWHSTSPTVTGHPDYQPVKFTNRYPEFESFSKITIDVELTGKPGSTDHKRAAKALAQRLIAEPELAEQLGIPAEAYMRVLDWMAEQPNGGYTWHHVENMTSMMMVPTDIHSIPHAGGADLLRQAAGIKLKPERWRKGE